MDKSLNTRLSIIDDQNKKSDRIVEIILFTYFALGIGLSFFYDTYKIAFLSGIACLALYFSAKYFFREKSLHHYISSLVVGIFMAQMIYQMHGLFELHFTAFIGIIVLMTYQNWKVFIPLTLFVVIHHSLFAYLQYLSFSGESDQYANINFTQLDYMDFTTFLFHAGLFAIAVTIAGIYAYQLRKATDKNIDIIIEFEESKDSQEEIEARAKQQAENLKDIEEKNILIEEKNIEIEGRMAILDKLCIISETDLKGHITYVNDLQCEVAQYSREEMIGSNMNMVRHPDTSKEIFKEMWSTIGRGNIFTGFIKNKRKDGTPYYIYGAFGPVLGNDGKPKKYIGIRVDLTESTIKQQNSRGVVEAIDGSNPYIEFSPQGNILHANTLFLQAMGYSLDEIVGKHHRMFVPSDISSSTAYASFWNELERGDSKKDVYRRLTKSGETVYLQSIYAPVKDDMGRVVKVLKIATDITRQYEIELETQTATKEATRVLSALSSGDLTQKYQVESKGDLKMMGDSLNQTINILSELITTVVSNAQNIASSSVEMSSSAQQLSEGATGQASSVEEISSSMEEMTANIQQNTSNSRQTEKISTQAATDINISKESVMETVNSMKTIASKISIIGEISRQTNLLALNAAVEAARAGEHGRGFAVVAAEVRKLAERSQQAATEIDEVSSKSVDIAQKSGEMLFEVVPNIQKTSDLVQEITASSVEQSSGAEQVNSAIQNLNNVVQENAATAEEMAASAEELNAQSDILQEAVNFFKLNTSSLQKESPKVVAKKVEKKSAPSQTKKPVSKPSSNSGKVDIKLGGPDSLDSDFMEF